MVHELHRLLPALVLEVDDGPLAVLLELETYFRADPFLGPVDHLPQHALAGLQFKNLHVETAGAKAKLQHAADFAFALRGSRPPGGKTVKRGQRLIDIIWRRRLDSDFVQDINHLRSLLRAGSRAPRASIGPGQGHGIGVELQPRRLRHGKGVNQHNRGTSLTARDTQPFNPRTAPSHPPPSEPRRHGRRDRTGRRTRRASWP
jgi:hypothetical protein